MPTFSFDKFSLALGCGLILLCGSAAAEPLLRCYVEYAGATETVSARPVADPYPIAAADIAGRFRFKAVMVGSAGDIAYIKLYAYLQTRTKDVPIHQASYRPPFTVTAEETALTPHNRLYAGALERELQYRCTLQQVPL